MLVRGKNLIPYIESLYKGFTNVDRVIADFFITNHLTNNLASEKIAKKIHVSGASLSRFAQKLGFTGYREFIYEYKKCLNIKDDISDKHEIYSGITKDYYSIIKKNLGLIDQKTIERVTDIIIKSKRIYIYGLGHSGFCANEMKFRFLRLGISIDAITDYHLMKFNSSVIDENCLVIGISISGQTENIIDSLKISKRNGAKTIMITANNLGQKEDLVDELLLVSKIPKMEYGESISPQVPILMMIDVLYHNIVNSDYKKFILKKNATLETLKK